MSRLEIYLNKRMKISLGTKGKDRRSIGEG